MSKLLFIKQIVQYLITIIRTNNTVKLNKTTVQNDTIHNCDKLWVYEILMKYLFLKEIGMIGDPDYWSSMLFQLIELL